MCKSASPVSRPSLIRDLSHVFTLLIVEKQSWGDKFVIWEEFMRPQIRKIGKTGYQKKTLQRSLQGEGGDRPPLWISHWMMYDDKYDYEDDDDNLDVLLTMTF